MKLNSLLGFLCLCLVAFTSCDKEEVVKASGSCEFKFDGKSYSANTSYGEAFDTTVVGKKALRVQGVTSTLNNFIILQVIFKDSLATGTYTTAENATILFSTTEGGFESTSATIKITSINSKYAEGEFNGILNNGETEKPLTDGKFKVNIN
ncbi:hypothetical protein [Chitinophaga sp. S165]|uniref:hypothetical protein n=1 Tax=Chitinophaga sp. S165 TaxID=2135462 RepID=UPI000D711794|nr:hypothetical protein [Chitinophaga sp. S165]PWV54221.1 hypothetical protein C7475_102978 [Chitinophaga sp. S165]